MGSIYIKQMKSIWRTDRLTDRQTDRQTDGHATIAKIVLA